MTDKAVSALTSLTGANTATGDLLYIVDISEAAAADRSKKITAQEIQNYLKKFPATIGVGGATPAASGAGVSFPATASASSDANTLDDYEEGDWSTSLTLSPVSSGSITVTDKQGKYVKVGRMVTVVGYLNVASVSSPVGNLRVSGLPFTIAADSSGAGTLFPYGFLTTNAFTAIFICANSSSTNFDIRGLNNGAQVLAMSENVQAGSGFQFTFTYFV